MLYPVLARYRAFFLWLALLVFGMGAVPVAAQDDFLDPEVAFVQSAAQVAPDEIHIHYAIAPGYYMYRTRFEITARPQPDSVQGIQYPPGLVKFDETFNEDLEVYYREVTLRVSLAPVNHNQKQTLAITSQGCADAGLCYPPITKELTLTPVEGVYQLSGKGVKDAVPAPLVDVVDPKSNASGQTSGTASTTSFGAVLDATDTSLAAYLSTADALTVIGLSLLLGVLLTFTPCVLPMVPIVLAVIAGSHQAGQKPGRWRGLSLAATYLLGVSVLYTGMGVLAGLAGAGLAAWLQTPWVLAVFATLLALLGLAMFNVYNFQAPSSWQSALSQRMSAIPGGHYGGAFIMGLLSALIVGPCVAAPLAGVLLFISQTGDWVLGGSALFALAWGQGVLLLVLGAGSGALLPKAGPWMEGVRQLFGVLLMATAWWMLNPVVPAAVSVAGWALLAVWSAVLLGSFEPALNGVWQGLRKALGLLMGVWGFLIMVGMATGHYSVLQPLGAFSNRTPGQVSLVQAPGSQPVANIKALFVKVDSVQELDQLLSTTDRPVLLDFYADWCVSCIEMEKFTFTDPVVAGLMRQFTLVQADVTQNTEDHRALLRRFRLFGPPGIMFFDANGKHLADERVIGFRKAADFSPVLQRVLEGAGRPRGIDPQKGA